jgi:hypothetical protein
LPAFSASSSSWSDEDVKDHDLKLSYQLSHVEYKHDDARKRQTAMGMVVVFLVSVEEHQMECFEEVEF